MRRSALLLLVAIAMFVSLAAGPIMAETQIRRPYSGSGLLTQEVH
jgi:hypothetical protein